jgi:hypothetical protein
MIFTSQYISLAAPTSGGVKKGFFAEGEAVQKKTMCGGPYPSHAGGGGAVFPKFATPHAPVGIPAEFAGNGP